MTAIIALAALITVVAYIYFLARRVDLGLLSLLTVELYKMTFGMSSHVLGGIHIDPRDAVSICLLVAGLIRTSQQLNNLSVARILALAYVALFGFSLVRGVLNNGLLTASNEARDFIGPLISALYFLTAPTDETSIRRYVKIYLFFGVALCAVAILAAAGLPVGTGAWSAADAAVAEGRYLPATGAAAIAICGFLSLSKLHYHGRSMLNAFLSVLFICAAVYLRHRTVWMMLIVGLLALLPLDARLFRRFLPFALVATVAVSVLAVYGNTVRGLVDVSQFSESASSNVTWEWRVNGWKELLFDEEQTPLTIAVGKSMGAGFWRVDPVSHQVVLAAPHSEYIQEYLRVGVVGSLLIFLFALRPLVKLCRFTRFAPHTLYPSTSIWTIVVLITLVFGITYSIDAHAYALIGIANAGVLELRKYTASLSLNRTTTLDATAPAA